MQNPTETPKNTETKTNARKHLKADGTEPVYDTRRIDPNMSAFLRSLRRVA
jgi:hypothetical protein